MSVEYMGALALLGGQLAALVVFLVYFGIRVGQQRRWLALLYALGLIMITATTAYTTATIIQKPEFLTSIEALRNL